MAVDSFVSEAEMMVEVDDDAGAAEACNVRICEVSRGQTHEIFSTFFHVLMVIFMTSLPLNRFILASK